jgi:hypothetical protein
VLAAARPPSPARGRITVLSDRPKPAELLISFPPAVCGSV